MNSVFLDAGTFNIALSPVKQARSWKTYEHTPNDAAVVLERLAEADIAITNKVLLTRDILRQLPRLKMIQITATGTNNVDLATCEALGIVCKNVSGYAADTVPEHTFALLLNLTRNIAYFNSQVAQGAWVNSRHFCLLDRKNTDIKGKTLGIIGYGTTGKRVAEIAKVFGLQVLVAEHRGKTPRDNQYTAFDDVLSQSDIISLHCPLTPDTEALINQKTLARMARQPMLLNLARGGVIDEQAVANAVLSGQLSGFATDVLSTEPPATDNPILQVKQPNVVVTPHNAWASVEAQQTAWDIVCQQVSDFIATAQG